MVYAAQGDAGDQQEAHRRHQRHAAPRKVHRRLRRPQPARDQHERHQLRQVQRVEQRHPGQRCTGAGRAQRHQPAVANHDQHQRCERPAGGVEGSAQRRPQPRPAEQLDRKQGQPRQGRQRQPPATAQFLRTRELERRQRQQQRPREPPRRLRPDRGQAAVAAQADQAAQPEGGEQQPRGRAPAGQRLAAGAELGKGQYRHHREAAQHRQHQRRSRPPAVRLRRQQGRQRHGRDHRIRSQRRRHVPGDLANDGARPPDQAPAVRRQRIATATRALQPPGTGKARDRNQQRAREHRIEQRLRIDGHTAEAHKEGHRRRKLQGCPTPARQPAPGAQAQPDQPGAFNCEHRRRGPRRERQRHRQGRETRGQQRVGLGQHGVRPAPLPPGQNGIDRGQRQRTAGQLLPVALQQAGLQHEGHQRRAEQQTAINHPAPSRRLPARVQQRQRQIEGEKQQQKGLGAGELRGRVGQYAPGHADPPGEDPAQQVELAPGPQPGDGEDRRVEQRVVGEEHHVVAAAGRQPDRRHEAGEDAEHCQGARVLQHREHAQRRHQGHAGGEGHARRQQPVQPEGRVHHQQQHADRAALHRQGEAAVAVTLAPGEGQRGERHGGDAGQAQAHRQAQPALVAGVLEQRGHAGQQYQHADLHRHVALGEPALHPRHEAAGRIGSGAFAAWCGGTRRGGSSGLGGCRLRRR